MKSILLIGGCGYIGSRLFLDLKNEGFKVETVDLELFGNYVNNRNSKRDYSTLTRGEIEKFDVIVNLAAHSSVAMANNSIRRALDNNVVNFFDLLFNLAGKKFIFASSSSVYNGLIQYEANEESASYKISNLYDLTKLFSDNLAKLYCEQFYGLRFGTVCGNSPNMRIDVMINKMVHSALTYGKIEIFNKHVNRPILGMSDLCDAIKVLITNDGEPGLYNLASMNARIVDIGGAVAEIMDVPLIDRGNTDTYDFKISSKKFEVNYRFDFKQDINEIVKEIIDNWNPIRQGTRI